MGLGVDRLGCKSEMHHSFSKHPVYSLARSNYTDSIGVLMRIKTPAHSRHSIKGRNGCCCVFLDSLQYRNRCLVGSWETLSG